MLSFVMRRTTGGNGKRGIARSKTPQNGEEKDEGRRAGTGRNGGKNRRRTMDEGRHTALFGTEKTITRPLIWGRDARGGDLGNAKKGG